MVLSRREALFTEMLEWMRRATSATARAITARRRRTSCRAVRRAQAAENASGTNAAPSTRRRAPSRNNAKKEAIDVLAGNTGTGPPCGVRREHPLRRRTRRVRYADARVRAHGTRSRTGAHHRRVAPRERPPYLRRVLHVVLPPGAGDHAGHVPRRERAR